VTRDEFLAASSMPLVSPRYPKGPYRLIDREYLLINYESDPDAIREMLPEPLERTATGGVRVDEDAR
jgi:acetoacetate decarboxylase